MTTTVKPEEIVSGIWKFADSITAEELLKLAEEWRAAHDGERYIYLNVRECSKTQFGINFAYTLPLGNNSYKSFFYKMTDLLKRRFGNDIVAWDISPRTWIVS